MSEYEINHPSCVIFKLPPSLQQELFGTWLVAGDVGKLDSALCSTAVRHSFLDLFQKERIVLHNTYPSDGSQKEVLWIEWVLKREVRISTCCLTVMLAPSLYMPFFAFVGQSLRTLRIDISSNDKKCELTGLIAVIATLCTSLRDVYLCHCESLCGLENLLTTSQATLTTLNMKACVVGELQLRDIQLPSLERLCVDSCYERSNPFLEYFSAPSLEVIVYRLLPSWSPNMTFSKNLRVLIFISAPFLTDAMLCSLVHSCPLLEVVEVGDCPLLTDVSMIELVQHAKHLTALLLDDPFDAVLDAVARHCGKRLQYFGMMVYNSRTCTGLSCISTACHNLLGLDLEFLDMFPFAAVETLLCGNPHLQELYLSVYDSTDRDSILTMVAASCPQLHHLNIQYLEEYTEVGITAVIHYVVWLWMIAVISCGSRTVLQDWS